MYLHEALARTMADQGITTVFGLMGDANLYIVDSFVRETGGDFVSVANEAASVLAANGYARTTGGLGVATVTHGPALTNTLTALVESVRERTPVLLIAGDTAVVDRENFQNISQRDVIIPTGAGFEQLRSPATYAEDLVVAIRRAITEQRPVVLNVPSDFQWAEVEYTPSVPARFVERTPLTPSQGALDEAVGMIASAQRPVVLAGRGATDPESRAALVRLAERIGAPLATTLRARDLFAGHPHNLGIHGTLSHEVGLDVIAGSDCLIAFGASLNKWTTAEQGLLEGRSVVQVDRDHAALNRHQVVGAAVLGDASSTADSIVAMLDEAEIPATTHASPELAQRLAERTDAGFVDRSTATTIDHRTVLLALDAAFPADRVLVQDGARALMQCFNLMHVQRPEDYVHTINFGSIGLGMGNAIGAAKGSGRPTLLMAGDGGFMLGGLVEFNTAVRHGLDIVVVLLNDGGYGAEHIQFRAKGMDPQASLLDWPDFAPVADSLGGTGYTVRTRADLDDVLARLPERTGPVLIDVKIDPDHVSMPGDH